jgi:uncharacterized protein
VLGKSTAALQAGTLIDYELRVRGVKIRWQSIIDEWEPKKHFVDRQGRGPYRWWHHTHRFSSVAGGTLVEDVIEYQVPGGSLGRLLAGPYVGRDLRRIFAFRRVASSRHFQGMVTS